MRACTEKQDDSEASGATGTVAAGESTAAAKALARAEERFFAMMGKVDWQTVSKPLLEEKLSSPTITTTLIGYARMGLACSSLNRLRVSCQHVARSEEGGVEVEEESARTNPSNVVSGLLLFPSTRCHSALCHLRAGVQIALCFT